MGVLAPLVVLLYFIMTVFGITSGIWGDEGFYNELDILIDRAENGSRRAQFALAEKYYLGDEVEQDYDSALHWFTLSAKQNHPTSSYYLGRMCENGEGIEQDFQAAFEWYMLAADFDHSDAQVVVGNYYYHGTNGVVKENRDEAFVWYGRAARMGNTIGMYSLALMYERGEEIKQSDSLASYWLKKSALQESPEGRYKVGRYYIEGKGIEKNGELARTWLESSSLQDYAPAMFLLGQMYLEGNEIPKNRVEGIKWIEEAIKSAQNDEDKQEYQRYLRQETDEPA